MDEQFEVIEKAIGPVIEIEERVPVWRMPATFYRNKWAKRTDSANISNK